MPSAQNLTVRRLFMLSLLLAFAMACGGSATVSPSATAPSAPDATPLPTSASTLAPATSSGQIPTPSLQPTDASIPAGAPASTVAPLGPAGSLILSAAEAQRLIHPGIKAAVDDLTRQLGQELDGVGIIKAAQATWSDASLGCPQPGFFYAQVLTPGIWLVLSYQGREFDYRVAGSTALPCSEPEPGEPLDQEALEGVWSRLAGVPTARSEVAVTELNGKIYVLGGFGPGATANEEYDPATNTWRRLAPIPRGVDHAAAVGVEGVVYLIGGFDGRWRALDHVWAYNPETDIWTARADLPTPRGALGAAVIDGKIYAVGGQSGMGDVGTMEVYDPVADNWLARSPMPTPRDHIAVAVADSKIYVFGGRLGTFARNLATTEEYDPQNDSWQPRTSLPTARSGIGAGTIRGRIYVFGGESVDGTFEQNERYEPRVDGWEAAPSLPTARHGLGVAVVGNRIYVLAGGRTPGGSSSGLNEVFILLK